MINLRALDAMVTEHVMGYDITAFVPDDEPAPDEGRFPHYSSDISAAWDIVENLRAKGWNITVYVQNRQGCTMHKYHESYYEQAENAALAICLAALKATGVELPSQFSGTT